MATRITLIDDEIKLLRALKRALESDGYEVFDFSDPHAAMTFICERKPDLVVSDIRMPGLSGLDLLERMNTAGVNIPSILMTAYSSMETAVAAMKLGARDYLLKPFEVAEFKTAVKRVLSMAASESDKVFLKDIKPDEAGEQLLIIGRSKPMKSVLEMIDRVADTESTVLLQGESGTGKELVAKTIHAHSLRCDNAFVAVNCSALPESLFESEMFGHIRGSFTGAIADSPGLFAEAEGGTLFLDEIGDLAVSSQAKLLRVLQDKTFKCVGDARTRKADVRVLAATNRNLAVDAKSGRFREDLLYRINVVEICLPPLLERFDDLPDLTSHFLSKFAQRHHRSFSSPSDELIAHLKKHSWPGNIRELENILERAVILKRTGELMPEDVPLPSDYGSKSSVKNTADDMPIPDVSLGEAIEKIESDMIIRILRSVNWNYSRGAERMGITRQNLHYKVKKYGICREPYDDNT
ncbi:MAG: sigma-54-dependent Fis family transcriptional regulator [Candidatus Riflebacteria bacterium]|nr:sigma-54-dependent Fis family transcriptional regulator [Candidatus Riflebacteria bacterium]